MARSDMIPVPGKPGKFFIPSAGTVNTAEEVIEDAFSDTVDVASGLITAGTEHRWFDSSTNKNLHHQWYGSQKRIPSHHALKLTNVGVYVRAIYAGTLTVAGDTVKVLENASVEFRLGTRLITKGFALTYNSGLGFYGTTTENNISLLTNGIPSRSAVPPLAETHDVTDSMDLDATLRFYGQTWQTTTTMPTLTNRVAVTFRLGGVIRKPMGI